MQLELEFCDLITTGKRRLGSCVESLGSVVIEHSQFGNYF